MNKGIWRYIWSERRSILTVICILFLIGIIMMAFSAKHTITVLGTIIFSFGTTFAAGAVVSFLDLLRNSDDIISNMSINDILDSGFMKIYKHRDIEEYYELMKNAKSIDVAGYSLHGFMQSHKDTIIRLSESNDIFRIRIVIVDPKTEFSKSKEVLEHGCNNNVFLTYYNEICRTLGQVKGVEIYKINFALSTMIFRVDDIMYVGPQFTRSASKSTLTMKFKSNSWAYKEYQDEFDFMCKNGTKLSFSKEDNCDGK